MPTTQTRLTAMRDAARERTQRSGREPALRQDCTAPTKSIYAAEVAA